MAGFGLRFAPAIKPRLKPEFKPRISATGISGIHAKPRILPSIPKPGGGIGGLGGIGGASIRPPRLKMMTAQSHTGRAAKPNPKPKNTTGIKTKPSSRTPAAPHSMKAQTPTLHQFQSFGRKASKANPYKLHLGVKI